MCKILYEIRIEVNASALFPSVKKTVEEVDGHLHDMMPDAPHFGVTTQLAMEMTTSRAMSHDDRKVAGDIIVKHLAECFSGSNPKIVFFSEAQKHADN